MDAELNNIQTFLVIFIVGNDTNFNYSISKINFLHVLTFNFDLSNKYTYDKYVLI
jgi:hypothetical protein